MRLLTSFYEYECVYLFINLYQPESLCIQFFFSLYSPLLLLYCHIAYCFMKYNDFISVNISVFFFGEMKRDEEKELKNNSSTTLRG